MNRRIEMLFERDANGLRLLSPKVGTFTCSADRGQVLTPGAPAGVLTCLDVPHELVVPDGIIGRVVNARPERIQAPVGHGTLLYELAPVEEGGAFAAEEGGLGDADNLLAVRAPHSGRFWHRSSPSDPPLIEEGRTLSAGSAVGLIEVMKTFTLLHYEPSGNLPERARVLRILAADGTEVDNGAALIEVEPA